MQQLREKAGSLETQLHRAGAWNEQVWPEALSLHFLEFLCCF